MKRRDALKATFGSLLSFLFCPWSTGTNKKKVTQPRETCRYFDEKLLVEFIRIYPVHCITKVKIEDIHPSRKLLRNYPGDHTSARLHVGVLKECMV